MKYIFSLVFLLGCSGEASMFVLEDGGTDAGDDTDIVDPGDDRDCSEDGICNLLDSYCATSDPMVLVYYTSAECVEGTCVYGTANGFCPNGCVDNPDGDAYCAEE